MGGIGADNTLEKSMVPPTESGRIGKEPSFGVYDEEPEVRRGEEEPDEHLAPCAPNQDFGQGIHGGGNSEERGGMPSQGGELIPEDPEALALAEMGKSGRQHLVGHDGNASAEAEAMEPGLGPRRGEGSGRPEERDPCVEHPGGQSLPVVKVTGEEEGGPLTKAFELCPIAGTN